MDAELNRAKALLEDGNFTCVLCLGEQVHTATARGVRPLVTWLDSGTDFTGYAAADKVVGKATAYLYCLLGVRAVYAHVMSQSAAQVLRCHGIDTIIGKEVPGIINRRGDGPCPFEATVDKIHTPEEALIAIRAKLAQL